jgi:type IV pilus assembly protein PilV
MVSVLVTSVSLLGMAGLQVSSKRAGHEAIQRTAAAAMTMDMLERMRSNPQALDAYATTAVGGGTITAEPTPGCSNDSSDVCTAAQLAAHDLWEWERAIDGVSETRVVGGETIATGGLVDPTGCITVAAGTVTITMAWEGYESLTSPSSNSCGLSLGKYGTNDEKRQIIAVSTFITDE